MNRSSFYLKISDYHFGVNYRVLNTSSVLKDRLISGFYTLSHLWNHQCHFVILNVQKKKLEDMIENEAITLRLGPLASKELSFP